MYAKTFSTPALMPAATHSATPWVERRSKLDVQEFEACYLRPRRPVVLTDSLRDWQALRIFTPNFFRQRFANVPVELNGRNCTLGEAIDLQLATSAENPGPYACQLADCTELLPYVTPRFACSLPSRHAQRLLPKDVFDMTNHLEILFSGPQKDPTSPRREMLNMHTWIAQVYGEREVILYAPGQERLLRADAQRPWRSTVHDVEDRAAYPTLRQARYRRVVLRPGDALFVPCGTWYAMRSLRMSITVAFGQLASGNWHEFVDAVVAEQHRRGHHLRAAAYGVWLHLLGPLLGAGELLGGGRAADWGCDGSTGWKAARRCPALRL